MTEHLLQDEVRRFPYTAHASQYTTMAVAFAVLGAIEGGVILIAIFFLTRGPAAAIGLVAGLVLYTCALVLLFSPLVTKHIVTPHNLTLHIGMGFKAVIPWGEIVQVESTSMRLPGFPGRVAYDKMQDMLVACMSSRGLVLVQLAHPRVFKIWPLQRCKTARVLFNVDEPEELLCALGERPTHAASPSETRGRIPIVSDWQIGQPANGAIETRGLTKFYGQHVGVEDLDLRVLRGEIYGLLGVNGAGKTTTLKMLVGLMQASRGRAEICGLDIQQEPMRAKAYLGYLAETTIIYEKLTGREFLEFMAELREIDRITAMKRIHELLVAVDLLEWADQVIRVYSFGMRRKIALAGAVIHHPAVLILDEPFNGLDPQSNRRVKDYLRQASRGGMTVLVSTHNLAIAEEVCDHIGIIDRGHLIAEGTAEELRQRVRLEGSSLEDVFLRLTAENEDSLVPRGRTMR